MKAAIVRGAQQAPVFGDFANPVGAPGKRLIRVTASSLSHVARSRASGTHYSSEGGFPFVAGIDGTGIASDGRRVYFLLPEAPFGAMAEQCFVDERQCLAIPDALDETAAAAMAIPGMSSWAALVERAGLRHGETVLVNGATGASGRLAIQIARHLGAGKVIATGRRADTFDELRQLGADVCIAIGQDGLEEALEREFRQGIDIVLDYLWGPSAEAVLIAAAKAGPDGVPIRHVQIGSASGASIQLPSAVLRSSALSLMGSGIGSIALPRLLSAIQGVLAAAPVAGFRIRTESVPLANVAQAWASAGSDARIVLLPQASAG